MRQGASSLHLRERLERVAGEHGLDLHSRRDAEVAADIVCFRLKGCCTPKTVHEAKRVLRQALPAAQERRGA